MKFSLYRREVPSTQTLISVVASLSSLSYKERQIESFMGAAFRRREGYEI